MRDLEMLLSDIDESLERMNGELKTGVREVRACDFWRPNRPELGLRIIVCDFILPMPMVTTAESLRIILILA